MENSKSRKLRTIQMKYPAPYSHPFLRTEPLQNVTRNMKKSTSLQGNKQRIFQPQCCWSTPKPITQGCDPYAPHLKYGVFPRKTRRITNILPEKQSKIENNQINRKKLLRDEKQFSKKGQHTDAHLFVINPIDKNLTRQLSSSAVMHVDIKPHMAVNNFEYKIKPTKSNRFLRNRAY